MGECSTRCGGEEGLETVYTEKRSLKREGMAAEHEQQKGKISKKRNAPLQLRYSYLIVYVMQFMLQINK